ncbi:MAG: hypothetical protein XXXJIFNMEKO3_01287 [Candidatus Erwinia impunctatus]|nr:hypothetical protein XXXJIFNMEKO_01287 [Culicoides impunctatus]
MKSIEAYYSEAKILFLQALPEVHQAIESLTQEDADRAGITLSQLKVLQVDRAWAAWTREKKLDGIIFAIQLAEPDKEAAADAIEFYLRQRAEALGESWETFCQKNQL